MSSEAFDTVAEDYDDRFSNTWLGRTLRGRVWKELAIVAEPGARVLEIGCGTGEDAAWLAQRGLSVLATDPSTAMVSQAEAKALERGFGDRVRAVRWNPDEEAVAELAEPPFDGVYSGFGALNCVRRRERLWRRLATTLHPGGWLVLVVMGPFCLMESLAALLRFDFAVATQRWRSPVEAKVGVSSIEVRYPSARELRRELRVAGFVHQRTVAVGTVLPPTSYAGVVDRIVPLVRPLALVDPIAGALVGRWVADHYLVRFELGGRGT